MTQINNTLYMDLAYQFHLACDHVTDDASADLYTALGYISADSLATQLSLLSVVNTAYVNLTDYCNNDFIKQAVIQINNYVIDNYSGTETTDKGKLDDFINSLDWSEIATSDIPLNWITLCSNAGFNINDWAYNPSNII